MKENNDFLILSHARHYFGRNRNNPADKGTDILIKGINLLVRKFPDKKIKLITFEYGPHVKKTKKLVNLNNLENTVIFLPLIERKELAIYLKNVDIVCGQFGHNSNFINGVVSEALSFAKPIITSRDDKIHKYEYKKLFEVIQANTPQEICKQLSYYILNKNKLVELGLEGFFWYKKNIVEKFVNHYVNFFKKLDI